MNALEVSKLSYEYPDGTVAIRDLAISLEQNKTVGILGPNGAGKSTFMLHLNGTLRGRGEIIIDGIRLDNSTIKEIRRRVGLVFQDPDDQLFLSSVYDDVAFGPLNMGLSVSEIEDAVKIALTRVNMEKFAHKPAHHLSFGQKKLVAMATVLSMDPSIMVLDEPSSNLDPRARRNMIKLLQNLDVTKIISTHDMDLAWEICDMVVIMYEGRIVRTAATKDILTDEEMLVGYGLEAPVAARLDKAGRKESGSDER